MLVSLLVAGLVGVGPASAASPWPQWRGLGRDGVSRGAGDDPGWPGRLTRQWRVEVGAGQSSPVVWRGAAFLFSREGGEETARALDLETGRLLWRQAYPAPYDVYPGAASFGSGPRSTPVVHEGRVFTFGISGILSGFDAETGRPLWRKDFAGRFRESSPPFGTSMSPMMAEGLLVVHAGGHRGGALLALDPATGAERWVLEGEGPSYSSPILASVLGQDQIVIQVHRRILGVEPRSGRLLWSLPFVTPCDQNIVTPVQAGDLVVVSSLDKGTMAIRVGREGAGFEPRVVWHTRDVSMYMSTPVSVKGRLLGLSHRRRGEYFALDPATGAVAWKSPARQGENAAFVVRGESVLVLQGDGRLLVLPADADSFSPVASYEVARSPTFAHPIPTSLGVLIKDESGLSLYRPDARQAGGGRP